MYLNERSSQATRVSVDVLRFPEVTDNQDKGQLRKQPAFCG